MLFDKGCRGVEIDIGARPVPGYGDRMQIDSQIRLGEFVGVAVAIVDFEDLVSWTAETEGSSESGDIARKGTQIDVGGVE